MFDDIGRIVVVDDREYLLVSRMNYDDDTYVYLMSAASPLKILIAKERSSGSSVIELILVDNEMEKKKIYDLFIKSASLGLL